MAKKSKKRSTSNAPTVAGPMSRSEHHHVSMRKISNGYLVSQSGYKGDKHYDHETYHPKRPKLQLSGTVAQMEKKIGNKGV